MGMFLLEDNQPVVSSSMIEQLPRLLTQHCQAFDCAVFFATPRLAHLFNQDSKFLTAALSHVYQAGNPDISRSCVVGIVDKLPGAWQVYHEKVNSSEGLAFMATRRQMVLMNDNKASKSTPLVCFSSSQTLQNNGDDRSFSVIALPVANTLFINGRHSTLFRHEWTPTTAAICQDTASHPQDSQTVLQSVTIDAVIRKRRMSKAKRLPLVSLTEPRIVKTVMGNILREIEIEGKSEPASSELEKAVMETVKENSKEDNKVQIFALFHEPSASNEKISAQRILLARARLHKVTGGGGGWGQKRGLLSLDPHQVNPHGEEQSLSLIEGLDGDNLLDDQQTKAIAKAGDTVQFFQYRDPSHYPYSDQSPFVRGIMSWMSDKADDRAWFDYLAGTIPPQDLPVSPPRTMADDELHHGTPSVIPDHFGILSEGRLDVIQYKYGIDSYATSPRVVISIDVPNTLFNFRGKQPLRESQSQGVGAVENKNEKSTALRTSSKPAARHKRAQKPSNDVQSGDDMVQSRSIEQVLPTTTQNPSRRPFRRLIKDFSSPQEIIFHHPVPAPGDRPTYQDLSSKASTKGSHPEVSPHVHVDHSSVAQQSEEGETGPLIIKQKSKRPLRIRKVKLELPFPIRRQKLARDFRHVY